MKKILRVNGVDCANCMSKIENKILKLKGVSDCSANFMSGKIIIETDNTNEEEFLMIIENAKKIIQNIEPDSKIEDD